MFIIGDFTLFIYSLSLNFCSICDISGKLASLLTFLQQKHIQKAMLFLPTCACVDYWSKIVPHVLPKQLELPVLAIHGKLKEKRKKVLDTFRDSEKALLLCTDVMARGIDVPEVD